MFHALISTDIWSSYVLFDSEIHSIPVGGTSFSFLGRISFMRAYAVSGYIGWLPWSFLLWFGRSLLLSVLPFSSMSSSQPWVSNILLASLRYPIIIIKTQQLLFWFIMRLAILSDTLSVVLLWAFYIDQINKKLNCLHLTEKIRYFDLPDQTICSL